jgi:hypothetical protein
MDALLADDDDWRWRALGYSDAEANRKAADDAAAERRRRGRPEPELPRIGREKADPL